MFNINEYKKINFSWIAISSGAPNTSLGLKIKNNKKSYLITSYYLLNMQKVNLYLTVCKIIIIIIIVNVLI